MKLAEALSIRKDLQKRIQQFSLTATPSAQARHGDSGTELLD